MNTEAPIKAQDLRQALNLFDPEQPLNTRERLDHFSVERSHSPIDDIQLLLEATDRPEKFLFSGHRGSGKSTELARLTQRLGDEFRVVEFSVMQQLDLFELQYVDVLLSIGLKLAQVATQAEIEVAEDVLDQVLRFTREVTEEVQLEEKESGEIGATLNAIVGSLSAKLRSEDVTRRTVREKVAKRVADLLVSIDHLAHEIEQSTGKTLLVIVDDLDKVGLSTAKNVFVEHAAALYDLPMSIVCTFPTPLKYHSSYQYVRNIFNVQILSPIKMQRRNGKSYEPGLRTAEQIITKRITDDLIEDRALEELSRLSGGLPRQLMILAQQACLKALKERRSVIDAVAVQSAANQQRNEYEILINRTQRELLTEVYASKSINNDEAHRGLLHNRSVLQYRNDDVWYDVHPLVLPLIDTDEATAETDA